MTAPGVRVTVPHCATLADVVPEEGNGARSDRLRRGRGEVPPAHTAQGMIWTMLLKTASDAGVLA
jgi:hypothetical protein